MQERINQSTVNRFRGAEVISFALNAQPNPGSIPGGSILVYRLSRSIHTPNYENSIQSAIIL